MIVPKKLLAAVCLASSLTAAAAAQTICRDNTASASGQVLDITGATISNATVKIAPGGGVLHTSRDGRITTGCLTAGTYQAIITATGFEPASHQLVITPGTSNTIFSLRLKPLTVQTEVDAVVEESGVNSQDVAGSRTLGKSDVAQLADDPDEFARQLQVLAASAGGAPGAATITVDGFQNGGRIPPKSSIAFIRINPDLFAAEYARPPYRGGRIEIYTKPGQASLHGALFTTLSSPFINAKDPFSPSRAAIGKQRFGFELSGPIQKNRSDFALALEHRQIDQFAVVNAVTLDASGNAALFTDNVATPQSLWSASARFGVLLSPRNNFTATYTAGVNGLAHQGVGGSTLLEAGYNSTQSEHVIRLTNLQTLSARLVHESRLGYTWRYRTDSPSSTAPSVQVAGAFTGGGAGTGFLRAHERDLEIDDDILYTVGKHSLKAGLELLNTSLHDTLPGNFNGAYIFGGNATSTGLQQYAQALQGGTATQFNVTTGTPNVALNQLQTVLYVQDTWTLRHRVQLSGGIRWAMQNEPLTVGNVAPRLGLAWSPDKKQKTVFHLRSGLFFDIVDPQTTLTALQLNGTNQRQLQIGNPVFNHPLTTGTSTITTYRAPLPALTQTPSLQSHIGVEHEFPKHWHAQANVYIAHAWNDLRSRNINAPLDGNPGGPRPLLAATNLYQYQQSGKLNGNVLFLGLDQHSLKHLQIFAGYVRLDFRGDADSPNSFPQSAQSDAGEIARPSWSNTHQLLAFSNYSFPRSINLSIQFNAASGSPYNITTGTDNNGDGIFNDRPVYANATSAKVYATRFGALSPTGSGTPLGRNAGTLPWNVHLDANLSHTFNLPHARGKEGETLAFNVRSTNVLNHTNVTAVGSVLGSPLFGIAYAADAGRRVEAGLRWNF